MMSLWQQRDIHLLKSFMEHYQSRHEHILYAIDEMLYAYIKKPTRELLEVLCTWMNDYYDI